ncbi:hypothetical protein [Adhaeribacter terreus]|uniref:Oligosaccharide repeat unit polymerase n=1 Tax=Adhaeribacter terreus TaxID=529703 RepID=A0ABW0EFN4_9BACT
MPVFHFMLSFGLLAVLIFWLWRKTVSKDFGNLIFWPALSFKLLCGIVLGWFYGGGFDTFDYQRYANTLSKLASNNFISYLKLLFFNELPDSVQIKFKPYSNSFFFTKILSLLNLITDSNYYFNGLFLSFFSFAGCWLLVQTQAKVFPGTKKPAVITFLFFPTVIFWNAGVTKESVLMGALGFFWGLVLQTVYFSGQKLRFNLVLLIFFSWLLFKIKLFLALVVFALTLSWLFLKWLRKRFVFFRSNQNFIGFLGAFIVLAAGATALFLQNFADAFIYRHLVWNYKTLHAKSIGKPVIALNDLKPELGSVLINIPEALTGALFRPFFWEGENLFYRLAGIENLVIVIIFLGSLSFWKNWRKLQISGFYGVLIAFILILAVLIGLTTPNLGTLNRYRTIFLPFLLYLLLQAPFWKRNLDRLSLKFKSRQV